MLHGKSLAGSLAAGLMLVAGAQPSLAAPASGTVATSSNPSDVAGSAAAQNDEARQWAAANCVAERRSNTTAGAVIGGLLGAAAGSGLAGRHDRAAGAILGGATGAVAGGAIGNASTAPGCPPGYVVRPVAPVFYAPPPPPVYYGPVVYPGVVYGAPAWDRPWVWTGGGWVYRPYPAYRWHHPYARWW